MGGKSFGIKGIGLLLVRVWVGVGCVLGGVGGG